MMAIDSANICKSVKTIQVVSVIDCVHMENKRSEHSFSHYEPLVISTRILIPNFVLGKQ
jgi:hypothetical protein